MGVFYETIPQSQFEWIRKQKVFWVATAPLSGNGHVNVSPKGGPYFGVIDEKTFWYQDLTGSGNETISHLYEPGNGRITIMFNAFEGPPKIIRLWGKGRVLENKTPEFQEHVSKYEVDCIPGTRSIIMVDIHQVGSSCGFSVPFFDFKEFRPVLNDHFAKKEARFMAGKKEESLDRYWAFKNAWSMDNLPGMKRGLITGKKENVAPIKKMVGPYAPKQYSTGQYRLAHLLVVAFLSLFLGIVGTLYSPIIVELWNSKSEVLSELPPNWRSALEEFLSKAWDGTVH